MKAETGREGPEGSGDNWEAVHKRPWAIVCTGVSVCKGQQGRSCLPHWLAAAPGLLLGTTLLILARHWHFPSLYGVIEQFILGEMVCEKLKCLDAF